MALRKYENNKGSGKFSWHVRWKEMVGGKLRTQRVSLGSTKGLPEKTANSYHDMIISLVGTVEQGESFDRKQQSWLKQIPESLHNKLEKKGLVRERTARRTSTEFTLRKLRKEFLDMKRPSVKSDTITKWEQTLERLIYHFKEDKDVREITSVEATHYPRHLKAQGKKIRYNVGGKTTFEFDTSKPLSDSYVGKQVDQVKEFFIWLVSIEVLETSVFSYGVRHTKKKDATRDRYITLAESQDLLNSQYSLKDLARMLLSRFMGLRAAADTLWIRKSDIDFANGDVAASTVIIDSHKNGKRRVPMFHDANWVMFKLLCDDVSDPEGFLFRGEAEDKIREGGSMKGLTLASKYAGRYKAYTGNAPIPSLFNNCRGSWSTDLTKVFGVHQDSAARFIGHSKAIQEEHYLKLISEEHKQALTNWEQSCVEGLENTTVFFGMLLDALKDNFPALVEDAVTYARSITRNAMHEILENTAPNTAPLGPNISLSQPISDDLLQRVLSTTPIEELARNTLVLQGLETLIWSNKEASSLLKALLFESNKVAKEGLEPPTRGL